MKKFIVFLKTGYRIEIEATEFLVSDRGCVIFSAPNSSGTEKRVAVFPLAEVVACFDIDNVKTAVSDKGGNILPKAAPDA